MADLFSTDNARSNSSLTNGARWLSQEKGKKMHADVAAIRRLMINMAGLMRVELEAPLERLAELNLDNAETLSVLTSTLAAIGSRRHGAAGPRFLARVHALTRPGVGRSDGGGTRRPRKSAIASGLRLLNAAFEVVAMRAAERGLDGESAALVEMALLARLFATYRASAISRAVAAATAALGDPAYATGNIVMPEAAAAAPVPELALAG
jgi:hypothetical protein